MSWSGVNMATTQGGEKYNKLARPDYYVASLSRKRPESETRHEPSDDEPPPKRSRQNNSSRKENDSPRRSPGSVKSSEVHAPIDADCGMRYGFPGLDESDVSDDSTNEALAYLRSVRSEAQSIPHVLLAPTPQIEEGDHDESMYKNGRGDMRAFYKDGTWIARDLERENYFDPSRSDSPANLDPQEQYYNKLLTRYQALRKTLSEATPVNKAKRKNDGPSNSTSEVPPQNRREWLYALSRQFPTPSHVCRMDQRDVFQGLLYSMLSLDRFDTINKQQSCWVWALLAKAGEMGTLDYYKIGRLRELAQKAAELNIRLCSGHLKERRKGSDSDSDSEDEVARSWGIDGEGVESEEPASSKSEEDVQESTKEIPVKVAENPSTESSGQAPMTESNDCETKEVLENNDVITDRIEDISVKPNNIPANDVEIPGHTEEKEPQTLEEAKARLLAQLGDRLVQRRPFLSRAEAEAQRQQIREKQLALTRDNGPAKEAEEVLLTSKKDDDSEAPTLDQSESASRGEPSCAKPEPFTESEMEIEAEKEVTENEVEKDSNIEKKEMAPDTNTKITLDMIITVVAECYGQKDLLKYRDMWVQRNV
ncbi:uncharacterized protein BDR25DRAFT_339367 [Lindgomyces ingoldianus]|uniref:Uncharacterized protein n=1 Tax=Lindgomyces ingoldianus TaxID=673940 RepID=A0ACB6RAL9_9PLEO|nr:uncharacterized protein BDR25DRAFT_339367 [Lindgomyces ingoldianus]KAF2476309.1 hypothetical protein BDR25DRAFT_339367 [Lindgomyces ingoldianus]